MSSGLRIGLVAALVLALLALAAGPAAAGVPRNFIGVVSEDTFSGSPSYRDAQLDAQQQVGIQRVRQTFKWRDIELSPGRYDFSGYDSFVAATARRGIKVLPVLFDPPDFRSSGPAGRDVRDGTYPPSRYEDLGDFASVLIQRYGPNGSFWASHSDVPYLPIRSWQVWNEPNLKYYWPTGSDPASYVKLLSVTAAAIRQADPGAEVVTAGMPDSNKGIRLATFIRGMYKAGAKGQFDTLAVNLYGQNERVILSNARKLRALLDRSGDRRARMWITETGWATAGPGRYTVNQKDQAALLSSLMRQLVQNRTALKLRGVVYFNWMDLPPYDNRSDFWGLHTGLLDANGNPKPALQALATTLKSL